MIALNLHRRMAVARIAEVFLLATSLCAEAQSLSVLPVNIFFAPGQNAATMTVTNRGDRETAIQIRPFSWTQEGDNDQLVATRALVISPPIASIAPGTTQLVRLILRQPPGDREATYRILLDQLPPPAEVGIVHVVFRLSIPVFSQPANRGHRQLQFHIEREGGKIFLVGRNDGICHEAIRDIALLTNNGTKLTVDRDESPYILAGATRRWHVVVPDSNSLPNDTLRFTARADSGAIAEQISVVSKP